jgi:hypothetical protein
MMTRALTFSFDEEILHTLKRYQFQGKAIDIPTL